MGYMGHRDAEGYMACPGCQQRDCDGLCGDPEPEEEEETMEANEFMMFDTPVAIENFRRTAIRHALKFNIAHGFWPHGPRSNPLNAVRSYGWTGRSSKQALKFMEDLGDA